MLRQVKNVTSGYLINRSIRSFTVKRFKFVKTKILFSFQGTFSKYTVFCTLSRGKTKRTKEDEMLHALKMFSGKRAKS